MYRVKASVASLFSVVLAAFAIAAPANADALKTINNSDGGRIIYGQVDGQTTETDAMSAVLRQIRDRWGEEPQVGKFFRVRDTDSMAVFLTGVNHAMQDAHLAGLIIVSQAAPDRVDAAVLTNDVQRFGTTINSMLGQLFREWHPGGTASHATAGTATAAQSEAPHAASDATTAPAQAVETLHQVVLPDRSASASLPEGWQLTPASAGGTIMADGPHGEKAALGFTIMASNINDPRVKRTMMFAQGAGRNTSYARALYYPYGGDMAKMFVDLMGMYRSRQGLPPISFQISSEADLPAPPGFRRAYLNGHVDAQDGKGMREINTIFCCGPLGRFGGFTTYTNHSAVPVQFADQERQTMLSVISSYNVNQQVVSSEAAAFAAPEIARIHEIGRRAAAQAAASAHEIADAHNAMIENKWANDDKRSQAFSNYLLDQSVIQDNHNGHTQSTVWNQTADALVRSDPQRYEYVATPNLAP